MHHSTRPQHIRHHMNHQGSIHHAAAVGVSMGPQIGLQQQTQHHHLSANVPLPHGTNAPMGQYIPPHQRNDMNRFSHHNQPRLQQPMHQQATQSKLRAPGSHPNGLLTTALPPSHQQPLQHSQHAQQQSQHQPPNKFQSGAISHPPNLTKQSLKHATPSLQNKLVTQPSKKILSHLSHPPPPPNRMGQQNLQHIQAPASANSISSSLHQTASIVNPNGAPSVPKHVTILTKPPTTIPQLPLTQPPPLPSHTVSSTNHPNAVSSAAQASQRPSLQDEQQHHLISSKSGQLHSQNITNQSAISSTTNSVLVSHPQTQQAVVVQQQQQQQQLQQTARQGQSLENQSPIVTILQNPNRVSEKIPKETSPELIGNEIACTTGNDSLANSKEKTPMCLVNELARYNRIQHQYRLTSETGPAHAKRFTVTLKLGDEEYTAEGLSIKKAQHLAAADAISKTKYQHPPPKSHRLKSKLKAGAGTITPTVELNALAMKLGEPTVYLLENDPRAPVAGGQHQQQQPNLSQPPAIGGNGIVAQQMPPGQYPPQNNYYPPNQYQYRANIPNGMYNTQRFPGAGFGRRPFAKGPLKFDANERILPFTNNREPCRVTLVVGMRKFVGVGASLQAARHDAATRALEVIKPLVNDVTPEAANDTSSEDTNSDLKSPISLVHEIALKRNLTVTFEVTSERGQPHMKTFITKCQVGDIMTEGEGNGKKLSKKRAALNMLEELRKLPPISPSRITPNVSKIKAAQKQRKQPQQPVKRKSRNIIKEQTQTGEVEEEINPISRLIQIQQALKEREPVYTVIEERGAPRRREFVIEVSASGHTARGIGTNKKMAKRLAAENLLTLLGLNSSAPNTIKDASKMVNNNTSNMNNNIENSTEKTHRAKFPENSDTLKATSGLGNQGRQIVPGILLMQQQQQQQQQKQQSKPQQQTQPAVAQPAINPTAMNGIAHGSSETSANTTTPTTATSSFANSGVRPKDQLLYLGQILGFQVQYSDYPKGNHGAYLSIVTLTTDPPQLCHGAGNNIEESQDEASLTALRILSELGLDNVKPKKSNTEEIKA